MSGGSDLARPAAFPVLLAAAAGAVARARRLATQLGPDSCRAWDLLELAADVDRAALDLEAELMGEAALR